MFDRVRMGQQEKPRPIRRSVNVRGLELPVDPLLLLGEQGEVPLGGWRQCLEHVFQGIFIRAVQQIEQEG